jgi:hypothetical protein
MPLVYLDSNIYRQLGLRFNENIDYQNLSNLLETSGNEFGLLEVVNEELMDYYKNDIFGSILTDHEKIYKRYQSNPYLVDIEIPETTAPLLRATQEVQKDLKEKKYYSGLPQVPPKLILEFLLHNKRLGKKDNTRDFLIFFTLVTLCKEHNEDYLVLISQDEIFQTNDFFKKIIVSEKITNFKLYTSIPNFLKDFGPKLDFITSELLLTKIDKGIVENELLNDIKCFPSYVSQYYYQKQEKDIPELESLKIRSISINDYYVVKDYKSEVLKVNVTLRVDIKAIFKPETNKEELDKYLDSITARPYTRHQNKFDKEGRPIFDNNVLFIFEGIVDEKGIEIKELSFEDFIPDYFVIKDIENQLSQQTYLGTENIQCQHEFEKDGGYWKNSRYGGGLSWHYRCKKCGIEYDTGDFYD